MEGSKIKSTLVKSIYLVGALCVIYLLYKVTLFWFWNPISIENQTVSFLRAVQEQNYEKAAELFGWETEKTEGSNAHAWRHLAEEEGIRLLSFHDVDVDYDDGCFCHGRAELVFEVDENPLEVRAVITFGVGEKPKQICVLTPSGLQREAISQLAAWNTLACGNGSF